tara:strand:- start:3407 stop:4828 length:1422 start_codon:yes stop_codon:yes gene_type:complete
MTARTIFGAYEPDKPAYLQDGLTDMGNAYPRANGYSPVGAFGAITPALPANFNGGVAYVASDLSGVLIGGTEDGLYRGSVTAWTPLATGLSGNNRWAFTQFGDLAIAVNGGPTKKIDLITNAVADVTGAPTAACVATVRDFVVYGQADGNAALVQWSGFNNADSNVPGANQAGYQPMLAGGVVMGIAGGEYGIIVQRGRIVRMSYTGDSTVPFQFDEISSNIGAISRGSIAQADKLVFFLSDKGFMVCDGTGVKPIGHERVDATFFKRFQRSTLDQMYCAIDPRKNIAAWVMPGNTGAVFLYDWALDRWAVLSLDIAAAFSGFTANLTLEEIDALYPGGIDTIPYSLDDERFSGGDPLLLIVNNDNFVGSLSGANIAAWFTTPFVEYTQGRETRFREARPIGDAVSGVTITLDSRARLGDGPATTSTGALNATGRMPVRSAGRYTKARLDFADSAVWTFQQGVELEKAAGRKR